MTKEEVGRALGVTGMTYGRWEANAKEPDLATIRRLADFFGVSMGWLASGEGAVLPPQPEEQAYTPPPMIPAAMFTPRPRPEEREAQERHAAKKKRSS